MDCSPPGFSVHRILQARIQEWVTMPSSRGSSRPRDRTHVSCIGRQILYRWTTREAPVEAVGVVRNIWKVKLIAFTDMLDVSWEEKKKKKNWRYQQWHLDFWPKQLKGWSCHKVSWKSCRKHSSGQRVGIISLVWPSYIWRCLLGILGFPGGSVVKHIPANAGDMSLIPGSGRSPGGGNGNPL